MIEVEIRAKIKDLEKVKQNLLEKGAKSLGVKRQVDRIFGHQMFLDEDNLIIEGGLSARIRTENGKCFLELKEIVRQGGGVEVKSALSGENMGKRILEKLKFEETFTISKERELFSLDDFEICLDNVEKLGMFIEIEKMIGSLENEYIARKECVELLENLSPGAEIENRKYGDLMQELIDREKKIPWQH